MSINRYSFRLTPSNGGHYWLVSWATFAPKIEQKKKTPLCVTPKKSMVNIKDLFLAHSYFNNIQIFISGYQPVELLFQDLEPVEAKTHRCIAPSPRGYMFVTRAAVFRLRKQNLRIGHWKRRVHFQVTEKNITNSLDWEVKLMCLGPKKSAYTLGTKSGAYTLGSENRAFVQGTKKRSFYLGTENRTLSLGTESWAYILGTENRAYALAL